MRSSQSFFPGFREVPPREFGGSLFKSHPKRARPVSLKEPMHLVLRSTKAIGTYSFLHPKRSKQVEALVHRVGKTTGVKVYRYANSGNHLHLIVLPRTRRAFHAYVRALTGLIAREVTGKERGSAGATGNVENSEKFFDDRPYTRILTWGREFKKVSQYLIQNTLEALGVIPYQARNQKKSPRDGPLTRCLETC